MTKLEQYQKAYATLVGRIDTIITKLEESAAVRTFDSAAARFTAKELAGALEEAEEFFLDGDPEE